MTENCPNLDKNALSHDELIKMLANLQADLEARDVVIACLQCEQRGFILDSAKRHRYFLDMALDIELDNPILALLRDSAITNDTNETNIQPIRLDALTDAQKRTHCIYRDQLQLAEDRFTAVCRGFEDEIKRLERDTAQGDDVVAMLEKERKKLQSELEHERNQNRNLEKELEKALLDCNEKRSVIQKQRMVAAQLIKERRRLVKELASQCEKVALLEEKLGSYTSSHTTTSSPTVQLIGRRSLAVETSVGGSLPGNRKSMSPPLKCQGPPSLHSPPTSPIVLPTRVYIAATVGGSNDATSPPLPTGLNDCYHPAAFDSVADAFKAKSPPPVKTRPEPPIRKYPTEYAASVSARSRKLFPLTVETSRDASSPASVVEEESIRASTVSPPPPPPPQMQLHYPYPGMQGNTHHPPIRSTARTFDAPTFTVATTTTTCTSPLCVLPHLRSPTSPPKTSTPQFPMTPQQPSQQQQQQRPTAGAPSASFRGTLGIRATPPQLYARPLTKQEASAVTGGSVSAGGGSAQKMGAATRTRSEHEVANMCINGK